VREVGGILMGFVAYTFPPNRYPSEQGGLRWPPRDAPFFALNFGEWDAEYRQAGLDLFHRHVALARAQKVELLVALVHWGDEWHLQPSDDQRRAAHDLIESGFDLVVGGHSHVLNPAEVYRGRLIAYSLGDLIADFAPLETRTGALLEVRVVKAHDRPPTVTGFMWHPTLVVRDGHRITVVGTDQEGEAAKAAAFARGRLGSP
jgi:poly-gamma-glutamate synthesis protein (capsule biosynthesis protein)